MNLVFDFTWREGREKRGLRLCNVLKAMLTNLDFRSFEWMETGTTGQDNCTLNDFSGYGRDTALWEGRVDTGRQVEAAQYWWRGTMSA